MDTTKTNNDTSQPTTSSVPDEQNTTAFTSSGTIVTSEITHHDSDIFSKYVKSVQAGSIEDIKTFLARPYLLNQVDITTSLNANDDPITVNLPTDFTGYYSSGTLTGGIPIFQNKLSGFMGLRADFKIRVVVNANPFQQGVLLLRFVPFTGAMPYQAAMWNYNLTTKSQHQRVLIDVSCDSEAELTVPFVYPSPFINLMQNNSLLTYNLGKVYLTMYSALKVGTGGTPSVEVSVFGSMHNVELMGPVPPSAQSSRPVITKRSAGVADQERRPAGSMERTNSTTGAVLSSVGDLAAKIPLVSSFAQPLKWMSKMIDAPAAYFGMSNPILTNTQTAIQILDKQYWNNSDQPKVGYVLGVHSDNDIGKLPSAGGTDADEMSIAYIASRFAWFYTFNFAASGSPNDKIFSTRVAPGYLTTTGTGLNPTVPTPVFAAAANFTYWRGSIIFRFIFVKTKFHSGRVVISFCPGNLSDMSSALTITNSQYAFREIVDVKEGSVVEITCPYINTDVWSGLYEGGTIAVHILNPLKHPSTCANSIDVLVEAAGGPDFEVSVPRQNTLGPFCPTAQSDPCAITKKVIGGAEVITDDLTPTGMCIGEKVTSFRQLLARYQQMRVIGVCANGYVSFFPQFVGGYSPASAGGAQQTNSYCKPDLFSYYASMFAMYRGGICIVPENYGNTSTRISVVNDPSNHKIYDTTTDYWSAANGSGVGLNTITVPVSNQAVPMAKVPFYHRNPTSLISGAFGPATTTSDTNDRFFNHNRVYVYFKGSSLTPIIYRSIADDFSFANFVSTVPLLNHT